MLSKTVFSCRREQIFAIFYNYFILKASLSTVPLFCLSFLTLAVPSAVVVAHFVEWLLPTPEVSGLNPVIGKIYIER